MMATMIPKQAPLSIGHLHICEAPMLVHRESIALPAASIDSSYLIEQLNKIKRLLGSLNFILFHFLKIDVRHSSMS